MPGGEDPKKASQESAGGKGPWCKGLRSLDPFLNHLPEVSGDSGYQELPFYPLWSGPGSLGGGHRDSPSQDLPRLPLTPESLLLLAFGVPMIQIVRTKRSPEATGSTPSPRMEKPRTHAEQGTRQGEEWGVPLGCASAPCCEGRGKAPPGSSGGGSCSALLTVGCSAAAVHSRCSVLVCRIHPWGVRARSEGPGPRLCRTSCRSGPQHVFVSSPPCPAPHFPNEKTGPKSMTCPQFTEQESGQRWRTQASGSPDGLCPAHPASPPGCPPHPFALLLSQNRCCLHMVRVISPFCRVKNGVPESEGRAGIPELVCGPSTGPQGPTDLGRGERPVEIWRTPFSASPREPFGFSKS